MYFSSFELCTRMTSYKIAKSYKFDKRITKEGEKENYNVNHKILERQS